MKVKKSNQCEGKHRFNDSEEIMPSKYVCGKCGGFLYQDEDAITGTQWIACLICGNRYPPGPAPIPLQKSEDKSIASKITKKPPKKRKKRATKHCLFCGHIQTIQRWGLCSKCRYIFELLPLKQCKQALEILRGRDKIMLEGEEKS